MQHSEPQPYPLLRAYVLMFFLSLIWGTSFILIKKGLVSFQPVQVACLRMSFSALAFLPYLLIKRKVFVWSRLPLLTLIGIMSSAFPAILFATAQTKISSATAGVMNSLTPLFTLVIAVFLFKNKVRSVQVMGILLGLVGAATLVWSSRNPGASGTTQAVYALLLVISSICYATGNNIIASRLRDVPSIMISAGSFGVVGIPMVLYLFFGTDFFQRVASHPQAWNSLGAILILSWMGTVLATILYFHLIQKTSAVFGATVAYLMPIVAMGWGVLDGETIGVWHFLGMGLILGGVYLSRGRKE